MVLSVAVILLIAFFVMVLWGAAKGTPPLWIPLLLLGIVVSLAYIPLR